MVRIEDHCVHCVSIGLHCLGSCCPNVNVEVHYCDRCGWELDRDGTEIDGKEICSECYEELYNEETEDPESIDALYEIVKIKEKDDDQRKAD